MTDAALMDADCIHGWVWWDCPHCGQGDTLPSMSDTPMTIDEIEAAAEAAHDAACRELDAALAEKTRVADRVRAARAAVEKSERAVKAFRKRGE